MKSDARTVKFELASLLSEACGLLGNHQILESEAALQQLRDELIQLRCSVVVVGEFKRGKSTFINALLGRSILPADILPTTATVNRVTWGIQPSVSLYLHNGDVETDLSIENLPEYVTKLTEESSEQASRIKEAVVQYPLRFCREGCDLIDTPGLQDEASMTAVTEQVLEYVDVALLVVMASVPFSQTEAMLLDRLLTSQVANVTVIVNGIDRVRKESDRERIVQSIRDRIQAQVLSTAQVAYEQDSPEYVAFVDRYKEIKVIAVSSIDALDGREENEPDLLEQSNFEAVEQHLEYIVQRSDQWALQAKLHRVVSILNNAVLEMNEQGMSTDVAQRSFLVGGASVLCERLLHNLEEQLLEWRTDLKMKMLEKIRTIPFHSRLISKITAEVQHHIPTVNDLKGISDTDAMNRIAQQLFEQNQTVIRLVLSEIAAEVFESIQSILPNIRALLDGYIHAIDTLVDELVLHGFEAFVADSVGELVEDIEQLNLSSAAESFVISLSKTQEVVQHSSIAQAITEASEKNSFFRVVTFDFDEPGDIWQRKVLEMLSAHLRDATSKSVDLIEPAVRSELQRILAMPQCVIDRLKSIQSTVVKIQYDAEQQERQAHLRWTTDVERLNDIQSNIDRYVAMLAQ